jgi:hypothetical protein
MDGPLLVLFSITLFFSGVLAAYLLFIQPLWAFVECLASEGRRRSEKVVWAVMMALLGVLGWAFVLTFWLGSLVTLAYGLFGTRSRALRRATAIPLVAALVATVLPLGIMVAVPAAKDRLPEPLRAKLDAGEVDPITLAEFPVEAEPAAGAPPGSFKALIMGTEGARALANFTIWGPDETSALPIPDALQQVAPTARAQYYYAVTKHEIGVLDAGSGRFVEMTVDSTLPEPSWPTAVAFDTERGRLVFDSRGPLYLCDTESQSWRILADMDLEFAAMIYAPDRGCFYAAVRDVGANHISRLAKLNPNCAIVDEVALSQVIPTRSWMDHRIQLAYAEGRLVCIVAPGRGEQRSRIYTIDPDVGVVRRGG